MIPAFFNANKNMEPMLWYISNAYMFVKNNKYHNNYLATVYFIVILLFLSLFIDLEFIPKNLLIVFSCFMILKKSFLKTLF